MNLIVWETHKRYVRQNFWDWGNFRFLPGWGDFSSATCRVGRSMEVRVSECADNSDIPGQRFLPCQAVWRPYSNPMAACHGIIVRSSDRLPSHVVRPTRPLVTGIFYYYYYWIFRFETLHMTQVWERHIKLRGKIWIRYACNAVLSGAVRRSYI